MNSGKKDLLIFYLKVTEKTILIRKTIVNKTQY